MKLIKLTTLLFGLLLFSCYQSYNKKSSMTEEKVSISTDDKEQIQNLIRQVLNWADSKKSIDILVLETDSDDRIYTNFDLENHTQNLKTLRETDFFASEFIENYNQIILTLDKKLRENEFEEWLIRDLPPFTFSSDVNPWCLCQDNLDWNKVEVEVISLDNERGELEWHWGNLSADTHSSWKEFRYKFKVLKENGKWKIAYLSGFDFKEITRKEREI